MNDTHLPSSAERRQLRLEVFYADFGGYKSAWTAAEQVAQARTDIQLHAWDVFDLANDGLMREKNIHSYPTIRLYRGDSLVAESTIAFWSPVSLERWIEQSLEEFAALGSHRIIPTRRNR